MDRISTLTLKMMWLQFNSNEQLLFKIWLENYSKRLNIQIYIYIPLLSGETRTAAAYIAM